MHTETKRIQDLLQRTYNGDAWHGSPITGILKNVTAAQARQRAIPNCHTIWELVAHISSWRNFAWNKLQGNADFDILTQEEDWPTITETTDEAWNSSLQALEESQQKLQSALDRTDDEKLQEIVPGRKYTFYVLLHGIIQHDLYHSGQMAIIKKNL